MEKKGIGGKIIWSPEDDAYIREHFPTEAACDIADRFGVSASCISRRAKELGLEKAEGWNKSKYYKRYTGNYQYGNYVPFIKCRQQ